MDRHVRRGEKGIAILAPIGSRLKVENESTGEERTIISAPRAFRVVHVFDVSQTDGEPLPDSPARRLQGESVSGAYDELVTYAEGLGFQVEVSADLSGQVNGDCNHMLERIRVREGLSPAQSTKTLAHEIAHAILHGGNVECREQAELEAESVAYIVCGLLGVDSAEYSIGYVAGWGGGRTRSSAFASLDTGFSRPPSRSSASWGWTSRWRCDSHDVPSRVERCSLSV